MTSITANGVLPTEFPVAVVLCYRQTPDNPWQEGSWAVDGIVAGQQAGDVRQERVLIHSAADTRLYLCGGFTVQLYRDEAESYYQNLMAEKPAAFAICERGDNGEITPRQVTLSYAEATSYMEMEEDVYNVALPPELYRWLEQYVLEHYVPEKKKKRKREDWKKNDAPPPRHLRHEAHRG